MGVSECQWHSCCEPTEPAGEKQRKKYLKEYHRGLYDGLLLTGKLYHHLSDIDEQAQKRYDVIVEQMKKAQGITERLKSENQFIWLQEISYICDAAREIINTEIIYLHRKCPSADYVESRQRDFFCLVVFQLNL